MKHSRPRASKHSAANAAAIIRNRLLDHHVGKIELTATQIKAGEVVLDRLMPKLSAIEHTDANPRDTLDPAELVRQLKALFAERPELLAQVIDAAKVEEAPPQLPVPAPAISHGATSAVN